MMERIDPRQRDAVVASSLRERLLVESEQGLHVVLGRRERRRPRARMETLPKRGVVRQAHEKAAELGRIIGVEGMTVDSLGDRFGNREPAEFR